MSVGVVRPITTVGKGVIIELIRRKDLYVLGMLMVVFCIGAVSARAAGIKEAATGTFLLNLGMTLSYIFAHLLTLVLAVRQVPSEIENRTIYPILARPVTRSHPIQSITHQRSAYRVHQSGPEQYLIAAASL